MLTKKKTIFDTFAIEWPMAIFIRVYEVFSNFIVWGE